MLYRTSIRTSSKTNNNAMSSSFVPRKSQMMSQQLSSTINSSTQLINKKYSSNQITTSQQSYFHSNNNNKILSSFGNGTISDLGQSFYKSNNLFAQYKKPVPFNVQRKSMASTAKSTDERDLSFLSEERFADLKLHRKLLENLEKQGFEYMSQIQAATIPKILEGNDVLGEAKTGSGKTLAFGIPIIQQLIKSRMKRSDGTGSVIIAPTRELALQLFSHLSKLCRFTGISCAFAIGGNNIDSEREKLQNGINLLIATPGRLLDHLTAYEEISEMITKNLKTVVIDEADRIMDIGFEETMSDIFDRFPSQTQNLLFSATLDSGKVGKLQRKIISSDAHRMSIDTGAIPRLTQEYVVAGGKDRLGLLAKLLHENENKKVVVFFSTVKSVKFHYELIRSLRLRTRIYSLHGGLKQKARTSIFFEFSKASKGILLATDVAARGLDIPNIDLIVQYNPPTEISSYFHRVGRTARAGSKGHAVLFLRPGEEQYLETLVQESQDEAQVSLKETTYDSNEVNDYYAEMEKYADRNQSLKTEGNDAMVSFFASYAQVTKHLGRNLEIDFDKIGEEYFSRVGRSIVQRFERDQFKPKQRTRRPYSRNQSDRRFGEDRRFSRPSYSRTTRRRSYDGPRKQTHEDIEDLMKMFE